MATAFFSTFGSALLNGVSFAGANYLFSLFNSDSGKAAQEERERHDRALEEYEAAQEKYREERNKLLDWI